MGYEWRVTCREFTLNMISEWFVEAANHTCGNYDPEIDEVSLAVFTTVPSTLVSSQSLPWCAAALFFLLERGEGWGGVLTDCKFMRKAISTADSCTGDVS